MTMHPTTRRFTRLGLYLTLAAAATAQVTLDLETTTFIPAGSTVALDAANPASASSNTASVATAYGSASASSSLGVMHLSATSSATVINGLGDTILTSTHAYAIWDDSILVTASAPALDGTSGRLLARVSLSGTLTVPGTADSSFVGAELASARWNLEVNPSNGLGEGVGGSQALNVTDYVGGIYITEVWGNSNFQIYDFYIPFTFGQSFDLHMTGQAISSVQPRGMELGDGISATANTTLTWLGITGVVDGDENPLSGITIQSTDSWITTSAVPEPSTYAVIAGLAALGLAAWRKRHRSREAKIF